MTPITPITLTILNGVESGTTVTLHTNTVVIGRGAACDVVLPDLSVSRRHCTIRRQAQHIVVADLNSANHTFLNNDLSWPLTSHILQPRDELTLGNVRLRVDFSPPAQDEDVTRVQPSAQNSPLHEESRSPLPAPGPNVTPAAPEALTAVRQPSVPIVITVMSGPDRGQVYSPAQEVFSIGRAASCEIVLHDPQISRRHATIKREGGRYRLCDENSRNRTFLHTPDEQIFQADLVDGDMIFLGQTQLRVELPVSLAARTLGGPSRTTEEDTQGAARVSGRVSGKDFPFALPGLDLRARLPRSDGTVLGARGTAGVSVEASPQPRVEEGLPAPGDPSDGEDVADGRPAKEEVLSRSEAFKPRANLFPKGMLLKPIRLPGSLRHWATLAMMFVAALSSYGLLAFGQPIWYSSGPVSTGHAKIEQQCATCHPAWGSQSMNATCGQIACHAKALHIQTNIHPHVLDNCVSCHTEHRGRAFPITGGMTQCWSCHAAGRGVRAFKARPLHSYYEQVFVASGQTTAASGGSTAAMRRRPVQTEKSRRTWLQRMPHLQSGLIFGHAIHEKQVKAKGHQQGVACFDCHTKQAQGPMRFPTHAECLACHTEVVDRDPQVAKTAASAQCLKCHTQQDGGISRVQRATNYVQFRHDDHYVTFCERCHFVVQDEQVYQPVLRSAALYPMPMEECMACHEQRKATTACLDCHQAHHRFPDSLLVQDTHPHGWRSWATFEGVLLGCVTLLIGAGTYTYFDTRIARRWMASLTQTATDGQAETSAEGHAREGVAPPIPERKLLFQTELGFSLVLDTEELPAALRQTFATHGVALSEQIVVAVHTDKSEWLITDIEKGQPYFVAHQDGQLAVYEQGKILPYPIVDLDRCIACHGCYDSCPKNVLAGDPVTSKSVVVEPEVCIALEEGCTICQDGCPTAAIRVTVAVAAKEVEQPQIDLHKESNIPGLFLAGEVVGASLIKKAINQGDQVIRYIYNQKQRLSDVAYDVIIVGSGPAGLGAALEAKRLGLRYVLLERGTLASTIRDYPREKAVLAEPVLLPLYGLLPMKDTEKESLIEAWEQVVEEQGIHINEREEVTDVQKIHDVFSVTTLKDTYRGANVLLAIGTRGNPRKLGVPGEERSKVAYNLIDAADFRGQRVLVVGGGDSAIEAAVALSKEEATRVSLSYRKAEFGRIKSRNAEALAAQEKAGRVTLLLSSTVYEIAETTVTLKVGEALQVLENDAVFALIGADPPKAWLKKMGINVVIAQEAGGAQW